MQLTLTRDRENLSSTVGFLSVNGERMCVTLEDAWHKPKIQHQTRIPAGTYQIVLRTEGGFHEKYLKRFGEEFHKGMLWITNVPEFEYILIHTGNTISDTSGCVLVGTSVVDGVPFSIAKSEDAYRRIYPRIRDALLAGEVVNIRITDPAPAEPLIA